MTARSPLVINSGVVEQLQAGDTLDAVLNEVDVISKTNDNGGSIVIGAPVYAKSNGHIDLAKADAAGTVNVCGLVRDTSIASGSDGLIQADGCLTATTGQWDAVTGGSGGLTAGSVYYLSAATAGFLTATPPATVSQYVVRVGKALSTTVLSI